MNNEIFEWFVLAVTLCIANYYPLVSGYIGMWHHADHMLERSYCLNKLAHIYNGLPLQYSNVQISQFNPFHD